MEIVENEDIGEIEAVEIQQEPEITETEVPEKFRGKTLEQLAKTITDQEKFIGRQSSEIGEVRKLADELLKSQFSNVPKVEPKQEVDFFENPQEAIRNAIENNPHVIAAGQNALRSNQQMAKQEFNRMHPDANSILSDPDFMEYVKSSSIRQEMYRRADQYDVESANELFGNFKTLKSTRQVQSNEIEQAERTRSIKSVSVDSGGSGEVGKKIYSGAALRLLQMRDRTKYDAMQDEILAAYRENRVR